MDEKMMLKMGERIRVQRLIHRMTRPELAKLCGVSDSSIAMYEQGKREPGIEVLKILSKRFEVTIDYLVANTPAGQPEQFLAMIDLSDEDILSKFKLMLDGRELTKNEAAWFISMVRSHRHLMDSPES